MSFRGWRSRGAAALVAVALAVPATGSASTERDLERARANEARAREDLTSLMNRYRELAIAADDAAARSFTLRLHAEEAHAAERASRDAFARSVRAVYIGGAERTLEMVLGSASFADLEARLPYARRGLGRAREDANEVAVQHAVVVRLSQLAERAQGDALTREHDLARIRDVIVTRLAELREQVRAAERELIVTGADRWQALFEQWLATQHDINRALALRRRARGESMYKAAAPYLGPRASCDAPPGLGTTGSRLNGEASWYGPGFVGNNTASGAVFDPARYTIAHKELPFGLFVLIRHRDRCVMTFVNDRGPYVDGRIFDLSEASAKAVGLGVGDVEGTIYVRV